MRKCEELQKDKRLFVIKGSRDFLMGLMFLGEGLKREYAVCIGFHEADANGHVYEHASFSRGDKKPLSAAEAMECAGVIWEDNELDEVVEYSRVRNMNVIAAHLWRQIT